VSKFVNMEAVLTWRESLKLSLYCDILRSLDKVNLRAFEFSLKNRLRSHLIIVGHFS
jgi:hypothetical protein